MTFVDKATIFSGDVKNRKGDPRTVIRFVNFRDVYSKAIANRLGRSTNANASFGVVCVVREVSSIRCGRVI